MTITNMQGVALWQLAAIQSSAASTKDLAEKYGVSEMTIWNCKNKITLTKGKKQ